MFAEAAPRLAGEYGSDLVHEVRARRRYLRTEFLKLSSHLLNWLIEVVEPRNSDRK